ncbi:uncharacterized protein LOC134835283 [Culicoides brevitarsis]|uniref:uncharacterized protein LOC134835283 n=1 Tax=Culicoides brevitarsis TaxID=469753 RepID=UPI00307C9078
MNDYTNSTVTKHVKLHIPPPKEFSNWNGLKADSKYRLRLQTSCPEPIDLDNPAAINKAKNNSKRIESFMEVDFETNGPPMTSPMDVAPDNALALLTPVVFNIPPAEDKDGPLFYSVGIVVDGKRLVLETGYDLREIRSQIPFSEKPIETFYKVCDIYKACKVQEGPEITVKMSSEINFDFSRMQLDAIESGLDRGEYNSSLNNILIVGMTLKHLPDDRIYKEFHQNIIKLIKAESKRIHKTYDDKSIYMSDKELFDYVQNVKLILETFEIRDRELIQELLSLLEKITALKNEETVARDIKRRRRKRQVTESPKSPVVKEAVDLLNLMDPNLVMEKLRWMCLDKKSTVEVNNIEYHVIAFNTSDIPEKFRVPNKGSGEWTATVVLKNLYDFDNNFEYCVGSAFNQSEIPVYNVFLFSRNLIAKNFTFESPKEKSSMDIAIHLNNTVKPENVACEMFVNAKWDDTVCKPSTLISPKTLTCTCDTNEAFRVKFVKARPTQVTESAGESLIPPTEITKSMEVTTEKIQVTSPVEASPVPIKTPENGAAGSTLATVGYSALGLLALGGIFGAISLYFYRHSKKRGNSFALDLQAIAAEARTKTPGITYSRFQDEHMMQGDHVNFTSSS